MQQDRLNVVQMSNWQIKRTWNKSIGSSNELPAAETTTRH